jgi:hypothetical protein
MQKLKDSKMKKKKRSRDSENNKKKQPTDKLTSMPLELRELWKKEIGRIE